MKIRYLIRILSFIFAAACCTLAMTAFASADNEGSIKYVYINENIEFQIYRVASHAGSNLEGDFSGYNISLEDDNAAATLADYVLRDNIEPFETNITNSSNSVYFNNIPSGVYLITGDTFINDNFKYSVMPVLAYVYNDEVEIVGKYGSEKIDEPSGSSYKIGVMKVWSGSDREDSITAQLIKDGSVYAEVELSQSNNWRYTWTDLDQSADWTVVEKDVPSKYTVSIEKDGDVFIIVNTYTPNTPDSPGGSNTTNTTEASTETTTKHTSSGGGNVKYITTTETTTETTTRETVEIASETTTRATVEIAAETTTKSSYTDFGNDSEDTTNDGESYNDSTPAGIFNDTANKPSEDSEENNPNDKDSEKNNNKDSNSNSSNNPSSSDEKLPQTGQLWTPVPVMAFLGIIFTIFGLFERQKYGEYNE